MKAEKYIYHVVHLYNIKDVQRVVLHETLPLIVDPAAPRSFL